MKPFTYDEAWMHVFGDKGPGSVALKFALHTGHADLKTWIKAEIADSLEDVVEYERGDLCRELMPFRARFEEAILEAMR